MLFWNLNDAVFKDSDKNRKKKLLRPTRCSGRNFCTETFAVRNKVDLAKSGLIQNLFF